MPYKLIKDDLFDANVHFFWQCNQSCVVDTMLKKHNIEVEDNGKLMYGALWEIEMTDKAINWIVFYDKTKKENTLHHECLHLVYYIFEHKGIPSDFDNQETVCYYQGYWVRKLTNIMKGKK